MDIEILFGSEVKALEDGVIEGHLVLFNEPDASHLRDVFHKSQTDYDIAPSGDVSTVYYDHGLDPVLKRKRLGTDKASVGIDEVGVWIKTQLDRRDKWEAAIYELAKKGKLGWSSGVPANLVERKSIGDDAHLITHWPLGKDASLTVAPAEWRANIGAVKSLTELDSISLDDAIKTLLQPEATPEATPVAVDAAIPAATVAPNIKTIQEVIIVAEPQEQQQGAPPDVELKAQVSALSQQVSDQQKLLTKVVDLMEKSPRIANSGYYTNDGGAADPAIKNVGDLCVAIARRDTKRLEDIYAVKLQSTLGGPEGAYLIPEQTLTDLSLDLSLVSPIGGMVRRIPVQSPSGRAPIRHYRTAPTASVGQTATASGLTSQKRAEGAAYTEETMVLDEIAWNVTDFASGFIKATRELKTAAPMIEALLRQAIQEDVANKEEFAILRGTGAGMPLGVLTSNACVFVEEDTDNTFVAADSDDMVAHLVTTNNGRVAWVYFNSVYTSIAPMVREAISVAGTRGGQVVSTLFHGYPHFKSQHLPAIGTNGYIVLADWSHYLVFEWGGLYVYYSEERYIDENKVAWFFGKNIDGKPALPDNLVLADGSYTASPFVAIQNKT